jgi:hypothetical protein
MSNHELNYWNGVNGRGITMMIGRLGYEIRSTGGAGTNDTLWQVGEIIGYIYTFLILDVRSS